MNGMRVGVVKEFLEAEGLADEVRRKIEDAMGACRRGLLDTERVLALLRDKP